MSAHDFAYLDCSIPEGMTISEWRNAGRPVSHRACEGVLNRIHPSPGEAPENPAGWISTAAEVAA